jgi:hypothetical protein
MQQFLINLSDLQNLIRESNDANRILITIDTPLGSTGTKVKATIKLKAVSFLNGGLLEETTNLAAKTVALSLDTRAGAEISGCPYPPGC